METEKKKNNMNKDMIAIPSIGLRWQKPKCNYGDTRKKEHKELHDRLRLSHLHLANA